MARAFPAGAFARRAQRLTALLTVLVLVTPVAASRQPALSGPHAAIEAGLLTRLQVGQTDRFAVDFGAIPDLSGAAAIADFRGRGAYVVDALKTTAAASQAAAIALVEGTPGARAESFWLRNTLLVQGSAALAQQLASLPGVTAVRAERILPLVEPVETGVGVLQASEPEWGVAKLGAHLAWDTGVLGSGIVVANVDTGVDFEHPALVNQYRGNLGPDGFDHNYNWWDPSGICDDAPCDNVGHGTHTMGTMVGGDGPGEFTPDIGVAPGARWMAAKGCEDLGCSEGSLLSSGEFILAPTDLSGGNPDPSKRPDIVNNSWGGFPGDPFYVGIVTAWRAAGIIPVFSSGNPGPFCGEGGSPGDYLESFSVGATDIGDVIADFSGRGPSVFGKINPDVSAPGVDVVSSVPGGGYATASGTSMAAPHAAGTLALVLSADPVALIGQVDAATSFVRQTALDIVDTSCGGEADGDPNNVYGDGRIDAFAAVQLVATGGTLAGVVTDAETGSPIAGAQVSASNELRTFTATTDAAGAYELFLAAGFYVVTAESFGYETSIAEGVEIVADQVTPQDFALAPLPRFEVSGVVTAAEDGSPIEGAGVKAIGTPVPPAPTDAAGAYTLVLPQGSYTLRASAGGCTDPATADIDLFANLTVDFELSRKLDDFGHGCRPIAFNWIDAGTQSALFGDEFAGRLRLPFDFPFYGETYAQVFLSDNGYLNFLDADQGNPLPVEIPNPEPPNAAVYVLWQDLEIKDVGGIDYDTVGSAPNRAFVIEYSQVSAGTQTLDLEVKLWEDGRIDLLYGDNPANPGDGRNAGIGIENQAGDDALQFSFMSDLLTPNSAFRFSEVPTGMVRGTVTDANDGLPIEGATISASPGSRSTRTDADGTYQLRLLPGSYTLTIGADGYASVETDITIAAGEELVVDAALLAPIGSVTPTSIVASTELGTTTTAVVTVANNGTAPLEWEVRERPTGFTPPELPVITGARRVPTWGRAAIPAGLPTAEVGTIPPDQLSVIIEDPEGDATGAVDITTVRAGANPAEMTMAVDLSAASPAGEAVGFVLLDTDQDPTTGVPAEAFFGLPTQDVGLEYFVDLFFIHDPEPVALIVNALTFEIVAVTPARVEGQTIGFDVPLEAIGADDGFVNTALVLGDFFAPTDWAPDVGHGTVEPFSDAPWVSEDPESGVVDPGRSTEVVVTLGGPDVDPGHYTGMLVFLTSDPKNGPFNVDLSLDVTLPASFGGATGTVTDAHSGSPLAGVTVSVEAQRDGSPYPVTEMTGADGTYLLFAPEGSWPASFTLGGYVPVAGAVSITRGTTTPGQDAALHREQPHATLDGGPFHFVLPQGRTGTGTLTLGNPGGHANLTFEVGEISLTPTAASAAGQGEWLARNAIGVTARANGDEQAFAHPSSFRWTPNAPSAAGQVLVYADDPIHPAPATYVDQALQRLGLAYTAHYDADFAGFEADLAAGGWDMVIFADDNFIPEPSTLDALLAWVEGGGRLAIHSWTVGVDPTHPLWSALGIEWQGDDIDPPDPVYWWQPSHPAFLVPEPVPELTSLDGGLFQVYGQAVEPIGGGEALAGYTTPGPDPGQAALVLGATRTTIFRGFMDGQNGADSDADGVLDGVELWTNLAFGLQSGFLSDVPWLTITPESGELAPDETATLTVSVDSTGVEPGVHEALAVVQTNDPDHRTLSVPVTLVVPAYQQGINAGGGAYTTTVGTPYAADKAYSAGSFGYEGSSTTRRTRDAIAGTVEDPLYQDMRRSMAAYRFDVPVDGIYRVDLHFAEIQAQSAGARIFDVMIEGQVVLANFDVFAEAGGRNVALDRSFDVPVTDGRVDVQFVAQRGDQPMVNAILVTHRPDLE